MAYPKIATPVFSLLLHNPQHAWYITAAFWCVPWMKFLPIVAIRDVYAFVTCNRVRVDCCGRRDAVLPFFLHLSMHDEERIVGKMNGKLTFGIGVATVGWVAALRVFGQNSPHAKLPCNTKRERADNGAWAEIGELVRMPPNAFLRAVVAVDKCCVGRPWFRRLILELFPTMMGTNALCYLSVDGVSDTLLYFVQLRSNLAHIL